MTALLARPWLFTLLYGLVLAVLAARAPIRTMGDGGEYLAYALNLSHGHAPALTDSSIATTRADIAPFDPELSRWRIEEAGRRSPDGRQDFVHFWLFPALSAPGVAVLRTLGADPRWSFTLINIALLMAASYVVCRWVGWGAAILLLGGPIVWWSNKVHVEAFIVSLMMIAFALWRDRPGLAMICAGLVAAQVPSFAVFVPMLAIATLMRKRDAWRAPSFLAGLGAGVLLACLPVFYYFARFGTPSLLADVAQPHWPSATELGAVLWDLNLGLVPNWPLLALAAVVAVASAIAAGPRRLVQPDMLMAVAGGVVLMLSFPQVGNLMHGATPGIIRYAVWLTPLAIPVLAVATHTAAHRTIVVIALVSSALSLVHYSPSVPEFGHRPTALSLWVWRHAPSLSHPLPEVFARSLDQRGGTLPVFAPGCDKILLVGRGKKQGMWPRPCPPEPVPDQCREPAVRCYANRSGQTYSFRPAPEPIDGLHYDPSSVWPRDGETAVATVLKQFDWWTLRRVAPDAPGGLIAGAQGVRVDYVFAGDRQYVVLLSGAEPDARLDVRAAGRVEGVIIDGETGVSLPVVAASAVGSRTQSLTLSSSPHALLVLGLRTN